MCEVKCVCADMSVCVVFVLAVFEPKITAALTPPTWRCVEKCYFLSENAGDDKKNKGRMMARE